MRRLVVPDLAMAGAVITVLFCLFLFDGGRKLFRDSDTGWHIRTGERILQSRELPRTDPYSWTRRGQPWFAWEWGAAAVMGAAHGWYGLAGVVLVYCFAIGLCTWLWFRLTWAVGGDFLVACAMASPFLSTANLHWLARPHVFGWVLLAAWILWLEQRKRPPAWADALIAVAASAIWVNIHASFFLLPALCGLYAAGRWLRRVLWEAPTPDPGPGRFALLASAGAVGSLLNPYGWNLHLHAANYLFNRELLQRIGEFQTFNFHTEGATQIVITVLLASFGAALALGQRRIEHVLVLGCFLVLALRSARALPILALLLPLANGAITGALRGAANIRPRVAGLLRSALRYSANLREIDSGLAGWLAIPVVIALAAVSLRSPLLAQRTGFPPDEFPVAAAPEVAKLSTGARLFAPDKFGGYLIYRFDGSRPVFFDGRSDFYGLDFMKDYIEIVQVRPGWKDKFERWRPTHALLPPNYSLLAALESLGWRRLYTGPVAVLLERPEPSSPR